MSVRLPLNGSMRPAGVTGGSCCLADSPNGRACPLLLTMERQARSLSFGQTIVRASENYRFKSEPNCKRSISA